jgi:hypothetical protein
VYGLPMSPEDRQQAAIRKAARELTKPLERQLERAERTIQALSEKLADSERQVIDARRRLLECQKSSL